MVYIYVEITNNGGTITKRIIVEHSDHIFQFYKELHINGPSKIVSGHRIGYSDRIINIWIETDEKYVTGTPA